MRWTYRALALTYIFRPVVVLAAIAGDCKSAPNRARLVGDERV